MVPALTAAALEKNRDSAQDVGIARQEAHALILARPWLSLHTVILGSKELLKAYPEKPLSDVRAAFAQCKAAYLDREDPQRTEKFAAAMRRFAAATRALSEAIEPLRRNLPIKQKDEALMAATAYPVSGALDREVEYNRIDPFSRTWEFCLAGVVLFSLGFGYLRKPMFWLGIASVAAGLGFTVYGLATRVSITRLAPVTNMFETVVYVSLVVAILGLWFNLLPLFGRGLQHAWRLTAVPVPWEAGPLNEERLATFPSRDLAGGQLGDAAAPGRAGRARFPLYGRLSLVALRQRIHCARSGRCGHLQQSDGLGRGPVPAGTGGLLSSAGDSRPGPFAGHGPVHTGQVRGGQAAGAGGDASGVCGVRGRGGVSGRLSGLLHTDRGSEHLR